MMVNLQEDLTGFMAAASKFQIKGLSEDKVSEILYHAGSLEFIN